ncbi:MAG: protein kinase domain-containing protein, partial [Planctomycetota bacterium]
MVYEAGEQVGPLRIERELGRGAYGVVYLAHNTLVGRQVALKVLPGREGVVSEDLRAEVLSEARLLGNLNSPHIVRLFRLHPTEDGGWTQEMEFLEGGSLEDVLEEDTPLPLDRAVRIFRGVCLALKAAHAARIIHGDIKDANVLFGPDNVVKLADFGLARMLEGTGAAVPLDGEAFGSPMYMAPEVISGHEAGMASDLWAAAVLFYRLLTGRFPFPAQYLGELLQKILNEEPEPLGPEIPAPLADLLARCLVKQSDERLSSAETIVEELDRLAVQDARLAPVPTGRERPTNWVPPASAFVGREQELAQIAALLSDEESRVVTLTGPGGVGKSRLAQHLCGELLERFEGGCWVVDLAETFDAEGIALAVAEVLGVPRGTEKDPAALVAGVLQYRKPLLLVLDGFEQVRDHAGATVGLWMERAPHVRFLVTSQAQLALEGERSFELRPLPAPPPGSEAARDPQEARVFAGVRLFEDRARLANPTFELDDANTADVVRICRGLEGMPLAIELAAARMGTMTPDKVADRLGEKFQLLESTRGDIVPRQQTLDRALEWSYELLAPWEKEAFLQACYFPDTFNLEAAERVIDLSSLADAPAAVDVARSLRAKSLLTADDLHHETRLSMYGAIREYGQRRWREVADASRQRALAQRHADHYLAFAEEWNARIPGAWDQEALDRIALETGNLTRVHEWALEEGDAGLAARAVVAAAETMKVRHPPGQLVPLLERSLAALAEGPSELKVRLRIHLSAACQMSGDWDRALENATEAVGMGRELEAPAALAAALLQLGRMRHSRGHLAEALASFSESEQLARAAGDRITLARSTGDKGMVLGEQGNYDGAWECFCTAEALAREIADNQTVALHVGNRGVVCESRGELERALAFQREAEEISRHIGNRLRAAVSLGNQANVYVQRGDAEAGLLCYREAEAIARELGAKQRIAQIVGNRGAAHAMWGELDKAVKCYREAETLARELGDQRRIAISLSQRANAHTHRGEFEAALECYGEAEGIGRDIGDRLIVARNLSQRGSVYRTLGRLDEAWESLREGV